MYNLPNILTISRIAVIPFIFLSIYIHSFVWSMFAGTLFVVASVTDYLDGYLARARNETSVFGRLLDPIADKLLVATALVVILVKSYVANGLVYHYYSLSITVIAAFVILCREILVSGLREFLREVNVGLPVTKLAKWKTAFQMTALSMMLFCELWKGWGYIGEFLLWVAAVLTFITGYEYYQRSLEYVKAEEVKHGSFKVAVVANPLPVATKKMPVAKKDAVKSVKKTATKSVKVKTAKKTSNKIAKKAEKKPAHNLKKS